MLKFFANKIAGALWRHSKGTHRGLVKMAEAEERAVYRAIL